MERAEAIKIEDKKRYNIWMEGFITTGASAQAEFVGTYEEACEAAIKYCLENLI